jgi:hypothetical protein
MEAALGKHGKTLMKQLSAYLNDHLAGAAAAVDLLDHLIKTHEGKPLGRFFEELRNEVVSDQEVLKKLVRRLSKESALKKAGSWIAAKLGQAKMKVAGESPGEMGLVQALEALVLGITGKQLLWRALNATLGTSPLLRGADLGKLEERAIDQLERVETRRLEAAREAFLKDK